MLLEHSANVHEKREDSVTPLYEVSQEGHADVYTTLLEHNANVNEKFKVAATPLFEAAQSSHACCLNTK